ncbi:hypothetical protein Taro_029885, partial [Colocasia esculenta]|nr:hypothetical protein [Colocasia esculenta]
RARGWGTDTSRRHWSPATLVFPVPHFRELGRESLKVLGMGLQVQQGFITDSRVQEINFGPSKIVRVYPSYIVNGYRFHTRLWTE